MSLFPLSPASKVLNRHSFKNFLKEFDHFLPKIICNLFHRLNLVTPS
jgi:hypothetical protein